VTGNVVQQAARAASILSGDRRYYVILFFNVNERSTCRHRNLLKVTCNLGLIVGNRKVGKPLSGIKFRITRRFLRAQKQIKIGIFTDNWYEFDEM
jgi:hypothetical protein